VRDVKLDLIYYAIFDSSLGDIVLVSKNERLIKLGIEREGKYKVKKALSNLYPEGIESTRPFNNVCSLLDRYLRGEKVDFDVDVDISNLGAFTVKVLAELRKIPYGHTQSYGSIGKRIGYDNAGRAVGQAVGSNPIPIIIPCHRVIREDNTVGGFSLGINLKKRLLGLEGIKI
jgi:methylated-DNA-[protein]-cysteine S-methyltransferase